MSQAGGMDAGARNRLVAALLVAAVFAWHLPFAWNGDPRTVGIAADDAVYLLMADWLSPFSSRLAGFVMDYSNFPPLYPLLLVLVGAVDGQVLSAHLLTVACMAGGVLLFFSWARRQSGSLWLALLPALLFLLLPGSVRVVLGIWSEPIYLLSSMAVLWLAARSGMQPGHGGLMVLAALLPLTRTVGWVLLSCWLLWSWRRVEARGRPWFLLALVPGLAWAWWSSGFDGYKGYGEYQLEYLLEGQWLDKALFQSRVLWSGWVGLFDPWRGRAAAVVATGLLPLVLLGWWRRWRPGCLDAWYVLVYLLVIWLWPSSRHEPRFLFPISPLLLFYAFSVIGSLPGRYRGMTLAGMTAALLLAISPASVHSVARLTADAGPGMEGFRHTGWWLDNQQPRQAREMSRTILHIVDAARAFGGVMEEGSCVYTPHSELFMYHGRRLAYPPPLPYRDDARFDQEMRRCGYVFLLWVPTNTVYPAGYPAERLRGRVRVVAEYRDSRNGEERVLATLLRRTDR
jgi:hypothetical protein